VFLFSSPSSSVVRIDDGISGSQESRTWQFQLDQIPNAPGPDKSMARRSLQLRSLAGRIAAELEDDMVSPLLHLLPDPIYRYADRSIGILDGAAFAFLGGARAEFVMLIEAHSCGAGTPRWNVGIGQLTAWSSALTGAASQTVCAT
jgi:hypothetical protein